MVQGRGVDASLNEVGRLQSRRFYEHYKEHPFDRILISTLKRTFESVELFIQAGIPYEKYSGLDEISWGIHEGEEASEDRNRYFRETVRSWTEGNTDLRIEGGESPEDVSERQNEVIDRIVNGHEDILLVCMHGRALRILLCKLLDLPLSAMDRFEHANLGLYILEFDGVNYRLIKENSTEHMVSGVENEIGVENESIK